MVLRTQHQNWGRSVKRRRPSHLIAKRKAYRPLWESITHKDVGKFAQRGISCEERRHILTMFTSLMFTVSVYFPLAHFIQNLISRAL